MRGSTERGVEWFPDGRFNLVDAALDRWCREGRGGDVAVSWEREDGTAGDLDYSSLYRAVAELGGGLRKLGIVPGDRVAVQLPLIPEALVAWLAVARIGGITVPLFSGFGAAASGSRVRAAGARALLTCDGFTRRGKYVNLLGVARQVKAEVPSLEFLVVAQLGSKRRSLREREFDWDAIRAPEPIDPVPLPASHPFQIAFTSGTTGNPKGVVLSHAGFAVKAGIDLAWLFDVQQGERISWITDPGWVMAPIAFLGGLIAGGSIALYSGAIDWPDPGRLWRFVADHHVTTFGVSPTLARVLAGHGREAIPSELPSLRILGSSGEPWTPDAFTWLFERVGKGKLPIINYSGGTEVSGGILSNTTIDPIVVAGFAAPIPGMGADIVDEAGRSVIGTTGELVLRQPSPGLAQTFWNDPDGPLRTYWSRWPGMWAHGDLAVATERAWFIQGRSDDTLKVSGKRVGPAEVESVVNAHADVIESAAIGLPDAVTGQALIVFACCQRMDEKQRLVSEVSSRVVSHLGRPFKPRAVVVVSALPKTRSGKIMRRIIRGACLDEDMDVSAVDDPAALDEIREAWQERAERSQDSR